MFPAWQTAPCSEASDLTHSWPVFSLEGESFACLCLSPEQRSLFPRAEPNTLLYHASIAQLPEMPEKELPFPSVQTAPKLVKSH